MICDFYKCNKKAVEYNFCKKHFLIKVQEGIKFTPVIKSQKFIWTNAKGQLSVSVKNRNELADYDYLDKLTNEQIKSFLYGFNREWVNADFKHKYKKLHRSNKLKREIYNKNNARNRDVFTLAKVNNELLYCYEIGEKSNKIEYTNFDDYENMLNSFLDIKQEYIQGK